MVDDGIEHSRSAKPWAMVAFVTLVGTFTTCCYLHCYGPQWSLCPYGSERRKVRSRRKEGSSYVLGRKQGDRAELARSAQRSRPEPVVAASSRGLHRRTSRCVHPLGQDQEYGIPAALRDGPSQHPPRGAARPLRGRSCPHPLDGVWYPLRTPCYRHGRDHPPDPAKSERHPRARAPCANS